MRQTTSYIVTDMESDGPEPGRHSMLSFASVACSEDGAVRSEFTANVTPLPGAEQDADTMRWWATEPIAWGEATGNPQAPEAALGAWAQWIAGLPGTPVFVAHPLTFDGPWLDWYARRFLGKGVFYRPRTPGLCHGAGLDLPSLVMAATGWDYQRCIRANYPAAWLGGYEHTHRAIDDARGYAHLLRLALGGDLRGA